MDPRMVFAIDGGLTYFRSQHLDGVAVNPGEFAAEPVLWTDWLHHGTLRAASFRTRLLLLSANRFQELGIKNASPDLAAWLQTSAEDEFLLDMLLLEEESRVLLTFSMAHGPRTCSPMRWNMFGS